MAPLDGDMSTGAWSGFGRTVATSAKAVAGAPPPDTLASMVTCPGAEASMFTAAVMGG